MILICEYTTYGSFGLILNKPFVLESNQPHFDIEEIVHLQHALRMGGSMQQNQLMLLHASNKHRDQTIKVTEDVYLGGDFAFLQELLKEEPETDLLLCFGYTGWSAGELEKQFSEELWYQHTASKSLIFGTKPENIWRETLLTMGGKYTSIAMIPEDLTLN